jgi:hypothetical protein
MACVNNSDCGSGNVCSVKKCYKGCATTADCHRNGYMCYEREGEKFCTP